MVKIGKKNYEGAIADVLTRYHGIDQDVEEQGRFQLSVKALPSTVDRIQSFADLLKVKKQEALDTLVQIGFDTLCELEDGLAVELQQKFLYLQEKSSIERGE